jgi:hypothetical protein
MKTIYTLHYTFETHEDAVIIGAGLDMEALKAHATKHAGRAITWRDGSRDDWRSEMANIDFDFVTTWDTNDVYFIEAAPLIG